MRSNTRKQLLWTQMVPALHKSWLCASLWCWLQQVPSVQLQDLTPLVLT